MNILIFGIRENNPIIGGIERVSWQLANVWAEWGHTVVCLSQYHTGYVCTKPLHSTIKVYFLPNATDVLSEENVTFFTQLIVRYNIQIVLNQVANLMPFIDLCGKVRLKVLSDVKWVTAVHYDFNYRVKGITNNFFIRYKLGSNIQAWVKDFVFYLRFHLYKHKQIIAEEKCKLYQVVETSDKVVVLSDKLIPRFASWLPDKLQNKLCAIYNPIENFFLELSEKKKQLLYVGRLELGLKRVDRLIRIWKILESEFPDWNFVILGDGDYRFMYEKMVKDFGLRHISFVGFAESTSYYAESSILCLSSSSEGFGMVLLEAQMYGCIPVAYDSFDSLFDVIDNGVSGFGIRVFHEKEYVALLRRLMSNEELRHSISIHGPLKARQFTVDIIAKQWIELFIQLLQDKVA